MISSTAYNNWVSDFGTSCLRPIAFDTFITMQSVSGAMVGGTSATRHTLAGIPHATLGIVKDKEELY